MCTILAIYGVLVACGERYDEVRIVAQEYRFTPSLIRLQDAQPFRLTLVNSGREPHEFTSRLLTDQRVRVVPEEGGNGLPQRHVIRIAPRQIVRLTIHAPAGTYLFRCKVRGHAGMSGTIILK